MGVTDFLEVWLQVCTFSLLPLVTRTIELMVCDTCCRQR